MSMCFHSGPCPVSVLTRKGQNTSHQQALDLEVTFLSKEYRSSSIDESGARVTVDAALILGVLCISSKY